MKTWNEFNDKTPQDFEIACVNNIFKSEKYEQIVVPDGVTSIKRESFQDNYFLKSIKFPETIAWIDRQAFLWCRNLGNVSLPDSIIRIGDGAFLGCSSLIIDHWPAQLKTIESHAFSDCQSLHSKLVFPKNLETIGEYAFSHCSSLRQVVFNENLKTLESGRTFEAATNLAEVIFDTNCPIKTLPNGTFYNCSSLFKIILPDSLTEIGRVAFKSCALTQISLPKTLLTIGENAFFNCADLHLVKIHNEHLQISETAFKACGKICFFPIILQDQDQLTPYAKKILELQNSHQDSLDSYYTSSELLVLLILNIAVNTLKNYKNSYVENLLIKELLKYLNKDQIIESVHLASKIKTDAIENAIKNA